MSHTLLSEKVSSEVLDKIDAEIDAADYVLSDPIDIQIASEIGAVDAVTASNAMGFDGKTVVPKAQKEHTDRLAQISAAQADGNARGNPDKGPLDKTDSKVEKEQSQNSTFAGDAAA
jgi:hypothetical protein